MRNGSKSHVASINNFKNEKRVQGRVLLCRDKDVRSASLLDLFRQCEATPNDRLIARW